MLSAFEDIDVVGDTGLLVDAAVDGLRSWAGDGCLLIDADCMVDAISIAGFAIPKRRQPASCLDDPRWVSQMNMVL